MPQTHHYTDLPWAKGSFAYLTSATTPTRLVVFMHGFAGNPWSTWINFQTLIMTGASGNSWDASDLFFYKYPSTQSHIDDAAADFTTFFGSILPARPISEFGFVVDDGPPWMHPNDPWGARETPERYEEIVLVGHSEGGVALRQAVAEVVRLQNIHGAANMAPHQLALLSARLCLFAPAIAGAGPSGLKGALLRTPVIGTIASIFLGASRAYPELQPSSLVLGTLKQRTETYWNANHFAGLKAAVGWGKNDDVVEKIVYDQDDPIWREAGHDHVSICKPSLAFPKPLTFVDTGQTP